MENNHKDGGPAFPTYREYVGPDEYTYYEPIDGGLSKRELYALGSMIGRRANPTRPNFSAEDCFADADAMLAESERGKK